MTSKPYTWKEIREFLIKELKETKHIMTWGTLGSCNIEHDIDTIITKKPNSPSAEFYREVHGIFDKLNDYLKRKYDGKLIHLPGVSFVPEFLKLMNYSKKDLTIHTLIYSSYSQIEKDWNWALFEGEKIKDILKNCDFFFGSLEDLYSRDFQKSNYADNVLLYLSLYDRIHSNYDEVFLLKVMNYYFDYLFRKRMGVKTPVAKNKKEVREIFYKLCDKLDELNEEHKK